jgi:hypothetical protein
VLVFQPNRVPLRVTYSDNRELLRKEGVCVFRIRRRLIVWALLVMGLPLLAQGLYWAADTLEARRGVTPAARRLRQAGRAADGLRRLQR